MNTHRIHRKAVAGSAVLLVAGATVAGSLTFRGTGANAAHPDSDPPPAAPSSTISAPRLADGNAAGRLAPRSAARQSPAPRSGERSVDSGERVTAPRDSTPTAIQVESQFKDPGELTDAQRARCGVAQPGVCELQLGGHSTLTGTMNGWTDYTTWGHGNTDGSISYYSHETFTGTVAGCGRGTFDFVVEDGRVDSGPSDKDPAASHLHGPWALVPRSGTGDLARLVAGQGEEDGLYYPDSSLSGSFTGNLSCAR